MDHSYIQCRPHQCEKWSRPHFSKIELSADLYTNLLVLSYGVCVDKPEKWDKDMKIYIFKWEANLPLMQEFSNKCQKVAKSATTLSDMIFVLWKVQVRWNLLKAHKTMGNKWFRQKLWVDFGMQKIKMNKGKIKDYSFFILPTDLNFVTCLNYPLHFYLKRVLRFVFCCAKLRARATSSDLKNGLHIL